MTVAPWRARPYVRQTITRHAVLQPGRPQQTVFTQALAVRQAGGIQYRGLSRQPRHGKRSNAGSGHFQRTRTWRRVRARRSTAILAHPASVRAALVRISSCRLSDCCRVSSCKLTTGCVRCNLPAARVGLPSRARWRRRCADANNSFSRRQTRAVASPNIRGAHGVIAIY